MKFARTLAVVAVAATLAAGCKDSGPDEVTIADLVGTWVATSFTFANPAATQPFDLIANGGGFTLAVSADGTVTGTTTILGTIEAFTTTMTVAGGTITVMDPDVPSEVLYNFTFTLDGNTITMSDSNAAVPEALQVIFPLPTASVTIVATRQ